MHRLYIIAELSSPASNLTSVKLYKNNLSKLAFYAIMAAMKQNIAVTHLQIRENGVDDETVRAVCDMLKSNTKLRLMS